MQDADGKQGGGDARSQLADCGVSSHKQQPGCLCNFILSLINEPLHNSCRNPSAF